MNIFLKKEIAENYDEYYQTDFGKEVDIIEKNIINSFLSKIPIKSNVLELGCGTGHWTKFFNKKGFNNIIAVDISNEMLKIAKKKNIDAIFLQEDSLNLTFKNNFFDTVISITMLEFVENQDKSIKEITRVLKPNGNLILGILNKNSYLGKNKEKFESFRNAKFLSINDLKNKLVDYKIIEIKGGVYVDDNFNLTKHGNEPLFYGVYAKKI
jgi:ubiquinone/menaquinone biosynthesis C-methylase UbiE